MCYTHERQEVSLHNYANAVLYFRSFEYAQVVPESHRRFADKIELFQTSSRHQCHYYSFDVGFQHANSISARQ